MYMNPLKSTGKDQIAVALTVLKLILADFVRWGMKAAVLSDYPDLNGFADFEQLGREDVLLLTRAENPRSKFLLKYANIFKTWLIDYLNLFGPVFNDVVIDDQTAGLSNDIYLRLIYENPLYRAQDLDIDLELFAYSVMHVMYSLCELVIYGAVDLDAAFDQGSSYDLVMEGTWEAYLHHYDYDYRLVANLMDVSVACYNELTDLLLGEN